MMSADMGLPHTIENGLRQQAVGQNETTPHAFSYPAPSSVKGRTLADLLTGMKLTHYDVWERHGSSRASHHVLMLRKAGFPVVTEEIDVPTSDGRTARIGLYSLPEETIEAAGERGRKFIAEVLAAKRGD